MKTFAEFGKKDLKTEGYQEDFEEAVKSINVEVAFGKNRDKIRITGRVSGGIDMIQLVNPNRGGTFYLFAEIELLKKAIINALDKAQKEYADAEAELSKARKAKVKEESITPTEWKMLVKDLFDQVIDRVIDSNDIAGSDEFYDAIVDVANNEQKKKIKSIPIREVKKFIEKMI